MEEKIIKDIVLKSLVKTNDDNVRNCEENKCSTSDMKYIDARMTAVEEVMKAPENYPNPEKNVKETIRKLCSDYPRCSLYIQQKYGHLCAKHGLDWYTDENNR